MEQEDTISAIATGRGEAGIGIIRISGKNSFNIINNIFTTKNKIQFENLNNRSAFYGIIRDKYGEIIDETIVLLMKSPYSYTMEDVAEIQCHGGRIALRRILERTYEAGARPAEKGEFTKRAFLNGRIDLAQAQSVMDIVSAKTDLALKQAEGRLYGRFSGKIEGFREKIMASVAHLEAGIDFPEEEGIGQVDLQNLREKMVDIINEMDKMLINAHQGRIIRDGLMTVIAGKPNVGKSSMLNLLLGSQRAIVTEVPGTTRDSIEEYADVGGIPLRIVDTAGIRDTDEMVEKIGVERSLSYIREADMVLLMVDGSRSISEEDRKIFDMMEERDFLLVVNKSDLPLLADIGELKERFPDVPVIYTSTKGESGEKAVESLRRALFDKLDIKNHGEGEISLVRDEREADILRRAKEHLEDGVKSLDGKMGEDCISIDLRSALDTLGELTGENAENSVIDEIFSKFCIGK